MALFTKEKGNLKSVAEITLWQDRIKENISWHKKYFNGYDSWQAAYLLDRAIHWGEAKNISSKSQDMNSAVTIPIIAVHVRNLMPFLFNRDPKFFGTPLGDKDEKFLEDAKAQIAYLTSVWKEQKMTPPCRKSILDAAIIGHGVAEIGWGIKGEIPRTDDLAKKGNINYQSYIEEESPFVRRINPFLFIRDIYSVDHDLDTSRWCAKFILTTVQDLVDNSNYSSSLRNKIYEGVVPVQRVHEFRKQHDLDKIDDDDDIWNFNKNTPDKVKGPDDIVLIYKIYDRKFGNIITMIPGYNDEVLSVDSFKDLYPHIAAFPFEEVNFEEIPNEPYGYGPARYLVDIQHQLNRNRSKIYTITRACNPAWVYSGNNKLDPVEQNKLKKDEPFVVINLPAGGELKEKPIPKIATDLYNVAQLLRQDYTDISGEDILLRGGQLSSRTSAEEVRQITQLRGLRLETNVENTHNFVLNVAKQVLANAKRYMTRTRVVESIGLGFGEHWLSVSPESIKRGDITLSMGVIHKPEESPDVRRNHLFKFLEILTNPNIYQLAQAQSVQLDINALFRAILETFDLAELNNVFPGLDLRLPNINLQNQGNQPGSQPSTPEETRTIQENNVSPNSESQGLEGFLSLMKG